MASFCCSMMACSLVISLSCLDVFFLVVEWYVSSASLNVLNFFAFLLL